jgi:RsiW-degrading membrane proteinase PrsW (M82 family)
MVFVLLLIALAPCLFLLWYFYCRDKYEPEPKKMIMKIFLLGAVMVIPAGIIEIIIMSGLEAITSGILYIFIISFFVIAPSEELFKYVVVKHAAYNSIEFNEVMDGIVYTVSASLGFATIENIIYVLQHGMGTGIARAFLAVPGHAFFGAVMGYYIGLAKFNRQKEKSLLARGIVFAILLHGLYDFLILTSTALAVFAIPLIVILGFIVRKNVKKAEILSRVKCQGEQVNQVDMKNHETLS